jgi:chemotaxis protein MotB
MFKSGSAEAAPHIKEILHELAPVINQLPNKITINGHTDSKPFPDVSKKYTNWELSGERANAARFELTNAGYEEKKILRVSGLADSVPYNAKDVLDPMNRRISIIVMNKKSELQLLEEVGNKINPLKDGKPAEGGTPAAEGGHGEAPKTGEAEAAPAAEGGHGEAPAAAEGEHKPETPAESAPATGETQPAPAEAPPAEGGQGEATKTPEAPAEPAPVAAEGEPAKAAEGEPAPAEAPPAAEHH